jgi:hypothetical protein
MGNTPLHFAVGGSFVVNDASEFHETTYHAFVQRYASPFTRVSMGYTYYDDRISPLLGAPDRDQHEIWGNLESRNMAGVRTGMSVKYEMSARDAFDSYLFVIAELGYSVPLVAGTPGTLGLDMNSTARALYNTDINVQGVEVVRSGISAWQVGLATELRTASVKVTPFVEYQVSLEDAVNDEDPLWGGISVAYAF